MTEFDLGYGDASGVEALRTALADYLGRVRGVVADPERVIVTSGYQQGLGLVCQALKAAGATSGSRSRTRATPSSARSRPAAVSSRSGSGSTRTASSSTSSPAPAPTPWSSPPPTSTRPASCSPASAATRCWRWLREHDAIAIEDDYDAEYRYDRAAVGALQGLDPERVVYAGSASKTLAPALRLGWLVVPPALHRRRRRGEAPRRPGHGADRTARVRRLPRPRRARPPSAPHAGPLPPPARRARRRARRAAARGPGHRHRRRPARDAHAPGRHRRAGGPRAGARAPDRVQHHERLPPDPRRPRR